MTHKRDMTATVNTDTDGWSIEHVTVHPDPAPAPVQTINPDHYTVCPVESWDAGWALQGHEYARAHCLGYIMRAGYKAGSTWQDDYLKMISHLQHALDCDAAGKPTANGNT